MRSDGIGDLQRLLSPWRRSADATGSTGRLQLRCILMRMVRSGGGSQKPFFSPLHFQGFLRVFNCTPETPGSKPLLLERWYHLRRRTRTPVLEPGLLANSVGRLDLPTQILSVLPSSS